MAKLSTESRVEIRDFLVSSFTIAELSSLMFDLRQDDEDIRHTTLNEFATELIRYCERRLLESCLITRIMVLRPEATRFGVLLEILKPCEGRKKIEIIISRDILQQIPRKQLMRQIALMCRIESEDVNIIATQESGAVLASLPKRAADDLLKQEKPLLNFNENYYNIESVKDFDTLSNQAKQIWQLISESTALFRGEIEAQIDQFRAIRKVYERLNENIELNLRIYRNFGEQIYGVSKLMKQIMANIEQVTYSRSSLGEDTHRLLLTLNEHLGEANQGLNKLKNNYGEYYSRFDDEIEHDLSRLRTHIEDGSEETRLLLRYLEETIEMLTRDLSAVQHFYDAASLTAFQRSRFWEDYQVFYQQRLNRLRQWWQR